MKNVTLHKREDGSHFLFDLADFELQRDNIKIIAEQCNDLAENLTKYEATRERAKKPAYLLGVFKGKAKFIEEDRKAEIYKSLEKFPLGEKAKASLVELTIEEFEKGMYDDLSSFERKTERISFDFDNALIITKGDERCTISVNDKYIEDLRKSMETEVSEERLSDLETFREAVRKLWSLCDKGYFLTSTVSTFGETPIVIPSIIDQCMTITDERTRTERLTDENLINILKHRNNDRK